MEQFKHFNAEKKEVIALLTSFKEKVAELQDFNIEVTEDLEKIENSIKAVDRDILQIILIGAFSDGKTSVIAGWLGQELQNMKIDVGESSDKLEVYRPEGLQEKCEIIDSPGLFGDKFPETTKKYISGAHLILYVVDATNPIKESQKDSLRWIMKDLNKIDSTIFIINKMDEVVNLTDEKEFKISAEIKKNNLIGKLKEFVDLTSQEVDKLHIVCTASNPQNRGLASFWLEKKDEYEKRSRINELRKETDYVLNNTAHTMLIQKAGIVTIKDIIKNKIEIIKEQMYYISEYEKTLKHDKKQIVADIADARQEISSSKEKLFTKLKSLQSDLFHKIDACGEQEIVVFFENEIGEEGYIFETEMSVIIEKYFNSNVVTVLNNTKENILSQMNKQNEILENISNMALKGVSSTLKSVKVIPIDVLKNGIFAGRDIIGKMGFAIKFKPWGVTKLASFSSKALPIAGVLLDIGMNIFDGVTSQKRIEKLNIIKKDIKSAIKEAVAGVFESMRDDKEFYANFVPQFAELESILKDLEKNLAELTSKKEKLNKWAVGCNDYISQFEDAEFTIIED